MQVFAVVIAAALVASPKMQTRRIFVRVVDQQGAPVAGLATSDFNLTEAGAPRVVTKAAPVKLELSDRRRLQ